MRFWDLNTALLTDHKHAEFLAEVRKKLQRRVAGTKEVAVAIADFVDLVAELVDDEGRLITPVVVSLNDRINMDRALNNAIKASKEDNVGHIRPSLWCIRAVMVVCGKFEKFQLIQPAA